MFDQRDGGAEFVVHVEDETGHVLFLLDVHARHGFVKQQKLRLCRQRAGQFDALLQTIGQASDGRFADVLNFKEIDNFLDFFAVLRLFPLRAAPPDRLAQQARFHHREAAGHDVVQHAHPVEKGDVLEGPRDAQTGDLIGFHRSALVALEPDLAFLRDVKARDDVEHGGLARPVRPDDRPYLTIADVEGDIGDRIDAAEAQRDVLHLHQHAANPAAVRGGVTLWIRYVHSAAILCSGATTAASRISSVALILPLRPSS